MGMQLVDLAIQNGVDLDGSPIKKTLDLDTELWMLRIKDKVAVLKNQGEIDASKLALSIL